MREPQRNFYSDNVTGVAPRIMAALAAANRGTEPAYGADAVSSRLKQLVAEVFETEVAVFPVATGTAANGLALACCVPAFGAIYCHADAHINTDECGAPEFYSGGAKLVALGGAHAKLGLAELEAALAHGGAGNVHHAQPAAVSLTNATELGTVYRPEEIHAIAAAAHRHGLKLHMDGARFANAVARLDCRPAELTWLAGVDALSLGATKNGAMAAEAVVFFNSGAARDFGYRRKRAGHLLSKMRFLSVQLEAYLTDGLWLMNARHANRMADRLAEGLGRLPGAEILHPVEGNEVFVKLPQATLGGLAAEGYAFDPWDAGGTVRMVAAFDTEPEDVDGLLAALARHWPVHGSKRRHPSQGA